MHISLWHIFSVFFFFWQIAFRVSFFKCLPSFSVATEVSAVNSLKDKDKDHQVIGVQFLTGNFFHVHRIQAMSPRCLNTFSKFQDHILEETNVQKA
jgi:hypothetical protein